MQTTQASTPAAVGGQPSPGEPPADWRTGVSRVQAMPPPIGFPPERWRQVQQDTARLLDEHGGELHGLGWSATDLFGVHPAVPGVAVCCAGLAVVLGGARVVEATPEQAVFVRPNGARLTYRRAPSSEAVPLWGVEA